jgi:V/A-type H+/Na+-transporting ATPase subunit E
MPEDLQVLIDRLQRDAVDEGHRRARALVEEAGVEAAALIRGAQEEAARRIERADRDAHAFTVRSTLALEQASRDLLITIGQAFERQLDDLVRESVRQELRPTLLAEMLVKMAEAYAATDARGRATAVLLGTDDLGEMVRLFANRYRDTLAHGVELRLDDTVDKGFRLVVVGEHVEHDFTLDAIAETLSRHLRPHLAEILPRIARRDASRVAATGAAVISEPE